MTSRTAIPTDTCIRREERICAAFYRGALLTLQNPAYVRALQGLMGELLRQDAERGDVTVDALGITDCECTFEIRAKETGIAAGIDEARWLYEREGVTTSSLNDGKCVGPDEVVLRARGSAKTLFRLERVVVNLVQRMSGIATATQRLVKVARETSPQAHVVATRKTPWGLLDKRAVHLGGGGTHRLNLGDAILIKTNHLLFTSNNREADTDESIRRAFENRKSAFFFEVEVTNKEEAVLVARVLRDLQGIDGSCPCILMLDNFPPAEAAATVTELRTRDLHDAVLVEASGNAEASLAAYAAAGADIISVGALTHSVRVLDLSARIIPEPKVILS